MFKKLTILAIVTCAAGTAVFADVRQISWADLIPELSPLDHPLADVDISVRQDLARLARIRIDLDQGFLQEDSAEVAEARARAKMRKAEGVDLHALEQAVAAFETELLRRQGMMNTAIDGTMVKMPGYALPLQFSSQGATELFLVPFVGACIHVPPPPPNQIVSISLETPIKLASQFEPVWVTGRITIEQASETLSLVDGTAEVEYGYRLSDVKVEPYK